MNHGIGSTNKTKRIDIVNVGQLYVGIRAIETFLEHVVSHTENHANLDRYNFKSYAYQLNQSKEDLWAAVAEKRIIMD